MAVVSESVLVYIARKRNLAISVGIIALQAALTIALIEAADRFGLGKGFEAAAAAGALMIALGVSSLAKALLLKRLLQAKVSNWRWALVHAAVPAVVVGYGFTWAPEWIELVVGVPAILGVYALVVWRRGFDEGDKVLFRKQVVPDPATDLP
jgi:hypothetical protein